MRTVLVMGRRTRGGIRKNCFLGLRGREEARGNKVILVREETSPDDLRGMLLAQGILTARGGVIARCAGGAPTWEGLRMRRK